MSESILFSATTTGILLSSMMLSTSWVCDCTPSMAEMTNMMMSVQLAPVFRMFVKSEWPGVSMKLSFPN